jgi:chromosome segregation ATPase
MYADRKEIEDAVELLQEQVESLKQELHYKELELQQIQQELIFTNQELCAVLTVKQLTLNEAKELAKNILASQNITSESLCELLSAIYGTPVKADELQQIDAASSITRLTNAHPNNAPDPLRGSELRTKFTSLAEQSDKLQARSNRLRQKANEVKAHCRKLKTQLHECVKNVS